MVQIQRVTSKLVDHIWSDQNIHGTGRYIHLTSFNLHIITRVTTLSVRNTSIHQVSGWKKPFRRREHTPHTLRPAPDARTRTSEGVVRRSRPIQPISPERPKATVRKINSSAEPGSPCRRPCRSQRLEGLQVSRPKGDPGSL